MTDADRAKAAELLKSHRVIAMDIGLDRAIAAALASARAEADQLRDAMRALAEENEKRAEMARRRFPDSGMAAAYQSCAARERDLADGGRR